MKTCIIPHAGKKYAGDCRTNVFKQLSGKRWNNILYIAAVHEYIPQTCVYNDFNNIFTDLTEKYISSHTWEWVKDEIKEFFPKANVTILFPNDTYLLPKKYIQKLSDFLVIATTDLIHNFELKYTWYDKIYIEGQLVNLFLQNQLGINSNTLCCGTNSLRCLFQINQYYKLKGQVIDYYDSSQSSYSGIFRYTYKPLCKFVSYVGVLFDRNETNNELTTLDIKLCQGAIMSIINDTITNSTMQDIAHYLPIFNKLYRLHMGIFVSTKQFGITNSCIGNYDTRNQTTAHLLLETTLGNLKDSINRWNNPLKYNKFLPSFELLEQKSNWKTVKTLTYREKPYGIYIFNLFKSATFLPVVWKECPDCTPQDILDQLKKKGGFKNKESFQIQIYKAIEYK